MRRNHVLASLVAAVLTAGVLAQPPQPTPKGPTPKQPETGPADGAQPAQDARLAEFFEGQPEVIASGLVFTEGPLYKDSKLLFCDIQGNKIYSLDLNAPDAKPQVVRDPSGRAAGLALDHAGNIICAQFDGKLTQMAPDATVTTLADTYEGKVINSPNDVIVRADDTILFTDPHFGRSMKDRRLGFCAVFMLSPVKDGARSLSIVTKDLQLPNGLALSPDEKTLYVADYATGEIFAFDMTAKDPGATKHAFAKIGGRGADGMKVDADGNVYVAGAGAIWVFSPTGESLCRLPVKGPSNLAFGGADSRTLFITGMDKVYKVRTKHAGITRPTTKP